MTTDIELQITPRIEKLIWRDLGKKSVRQIAKETGLEPEAVLRAKNEMFESIDDLTILQKKQRLIIELESISQTAKDAAENTIDEFKSGMWNSAISAMKAVMVELNRLDKADNTKVEALNALRIKELVSLMYEVVDSGVPVIAARYEIPEDELFEVFNDAMSRAAARREALD